MYDIIGDAHGEFEALQRLLRHLATNMWMGHGGTPIYTLSSWVT